MSEGVHQLCFCGAPWPISAIKWNEHLSYLTINDTWVTQVNAVDAGGLTALMWAAAYGQAPTTALLLRAGAIHSTRGPDGETALHLAASGGHTEIIRLLLAAGMAVDDADDMGSTPLMYAAHGNHAHALNELLNHSADPTNTNLNDETALSIAVRRRAVDARTVIEGYLFMVLQPS